ncbi:MAG TPA: twin-arginine translocase subunit TatC [Candidatus Xenobia bacterium]|nr:twin-arginine translocase subunit TatC [Candidatus Xenobia bacterium]
MPAGTDPVVAPEENEPAAMGFFEHLAELRQRLINCLIAIGLCLIVGLYFWEEIYAFIHAPMQAAFKAAGLEHEKLIFTGPLVPVKFALQVGLYSGIFLAAPVIFWQLWLFVAPGLYRHERRFVLPFVISSSGLFMLGAYFAHRVVLPLTLNFLLTFGQELFQPLISVNEYFSLWLTMVLWMGVIFELPVLIFLLSWIGLVTPAFLWQYFRHALIVITVAAAAVTPTTDAFTMLVFAVPMVLLYIVGIGVSWVVQLRRARQAAEGARA